MPTAGVSIHSAARSRFRLVVAGVLALILLLALSTGAWLVSIARSALPQLDGTLPVQGLAAPVWVTRDAHGFPTIEASNFDDLFFAQGYVTAQDRLFQMDSMRRYAAGELAEVVGEGQLEHDRQQRILGIRAAAHKNLQGLTPEDDARLQAYARGVNVYLDSHRDRLPLEFRILGYSPKPWTAEDSMVIAAYMVEDLSTSPRHAVAREKILAKLGPELTADLYVNTSWREHPPTMSAPAQEQNKDQDEDDQDDDADDDSSVAQLMRTLTAVPQPGFPDQLLFPDQNFFDDAPRAIGSNNWVVSGTHTVSGKPLLSNDMHLGHQMPNLWYAAHLRCGQFDVAGVTLPGYPYVVVGHNQRVAWGFTNVGPTVEDVYVETFNAQGQYLTPEGWKQPEHRQEVIHVKGQPDVALDIGRTRHGPIVSDLAPGENRKLALRWTLYDGIRNPFFAVDSARNWDEFRSAFSQLDAPAQNVVYADVDGNIGYQTTGRIPVRATGDGSLPEDGSNDAHEWTSYIPFEKLPSVLNPPSGIIATANSRITPDGYPYSISVEWEPPWRTARIYRVLESGKKFSAADMLALQSDVYSELDHFIADRMIYAVDHAKAPTDRGRIAVDILRQWDGRMTADSAAPTIAVRAREELERLLLEPKLGVAPVSVESAISWKSYQWMMDTVWLDNVLQRQPKRWLPEHYNSYDELLVAAVEATVSRPDAPQDLNSWKWGESNPLEIQNVVLGHLPLVKHWTGSGIQPQSGSLYTVKAVTGKTGPSERITVDLANLDQSTLNLVTGEAGNFLSPFYKDEWEAWYKGITFPWPFSQRAMEAAGAHRLKLEPAK
jgi:penicillin amidase